MDGRPQRKVADYLLTSLGVRNLDSITTAGTVRHLSETTDQTATLMANLHVSVKGHGSRRIAVVAHHDCLDNPVSDKTQRDQLEAAVRRGRDLYPDAEVLSLWVNEQWIIERVTVP
jgi:hypothetical protein